MSLTMVYFYRLGPQLEICERGSEMSLLLLEMSLLFNQRLEVQDICLGMCK